MPPFFMSEHLRNCFGMQVLNRMASRNYSSIARGSRETKSETIDQRMPWRIRTWEVADIYVNEYTGVSPASVVKRDPENRGSFQKGFYEVLD